MITIQAGQAEATIYIPIPTAAAGDFALRARSTGGLEEVVIPIASASVDGFLARLVVDASDIYVGEWDYALSFTGADGAAHFATGVLVASEGVVGTIEYNKTIEYKEYGE